MEDSRIVRCAILKILRKFHPQHRSEEFIQTMLVYQSLHLTVPELASEMGYLRDGGYVKTTHKKFKPTGDDWYEHIITKKGIDLLDGVCEEDSGVMVV